MSSVSPSVLLLLPSDDESVSSSAKEICKILASQFDVKDVTIRSASVPTKRLLSSQDSDRPTLWVLLSISSESIPFDCSETAVPLCHVEATLPPAQAALEIAKWCSLASANVRSQVGRALTRQRQKKLVDDAQLHTQSPYYVEALAKSFDDKLQITGDAVDASGRQRGKVRDRYYGSESSTKLALVTTDRQSAFDRMLALVPYKGAVLNLTSAFWFDKTKHIIPNHLLAVPHPNVSIVKKCKPFPIEFVVRSYVTGSTSTSIWKNYQNGVRNYCGHDLPEGLVKNQKLWTNLLTPTTKEEEHDRPIAPTDIVSEGWMTQEDLDVCGKAALAVFALGQEVAAERGLILVDTKYEFGRDEKTGEILLIDEVHTPDSSRYWLASTYEERMAQGKEPDNIDKEFLRLWFRDHCDPYKDEVIPEAPRDLVLELARRYVTLFEMITWKDFDFVNGGGEAAISEAIRTELS